MKSVRGLFVGHLIALAFGLGGLLVALPHPELWSGSRGATRVFDFGMTYAGSLHILFGAAAVFAFGLRYIGARRTLIFFVAATTLSLGSELIGTGTGWPFGNYAYTNFLGYKIMGRVPFTIPLSWFYMGLTSYLLAVVILRRRTTKLGMWPVVALGVWFLTVWDLVLDPAMAHESMPVQFWTWQESGPYFGMPVKNFAGWSLTGLVFMAVSRYLWRSDPAPEQLSAWFPVGMYAANMFFALALSLSVGLWIPAVMAVALGLALALLALRAPRTATREQALGGSVR